MILLFEPAPPFLRWCTVADQVLSEGRVEVSTEGFITLRTRLGGLESVEAVGHLLRHGGTEVDEPVSRLTPACISPLEEVVHLLPEHNDVTVKATKYWLGQPGDVRHLLLCDTAFFVRLPAEASMYAVPYELGKAGVRRYGGFGLCHQWAWKQARLAGGDATSKVVSVYLGDQTNLAAIQDGRALETSFGFTSAEGIPSSTGCGDIDPTIIFQLHAAGMSFGEINRLLTRSSGFTGLLGRPCRLVDLLAAQADREVFEVMELYRYNILKYIGAFIAVLGGVDAVVFIAEHLEKAAELSLQICQDLEFAGVRCEDRPRGGRDHWRLTKPESRVSAFALKYDKWCIMAGEVNDFIDVQGGPQ